jgi:hypothetical protein
MQEGKGACMEKTVFDPDSSTNGMLDAERTAQNIEARGADAMDRAVADLLQQKSLVNAFGDQGEWEVRTTLIANRQTWRYHSCVYLHGKERKKGFPPIDVDRTRQMRQSGPVSEELLSAFAREAAEVHIARCDSIKEYLAIAPFFTQLVPRHRRTKKVALVLLSVGALLTAYWWWKDVRGVGPVTPGQQSPAYSLQWEPLQVSYQYRVGEPFELPLPLLGRMSEGMPVEATLEPSGDRPGWLELDRERLLIRGTAPLTAANQTYRLNVRAHTAQEGGGRLLILLTIVGPPDASGTVRQLRGHWTW